MSTNYKIFLSLFLGFIAVSQKLVAQKVTDLKINDQCPNVFIPEIINFEKKSANLNDFRGKPLIIDFWFTGCSGCIDAMPHLDSLQKEFGNEIQILLATFQDKKTIESFFKTNRHVKNLKFAQVVSDKNLKKLFPAITNPHQVWIDKDGIVKAITAGGFTTRENVRRLINGENFNFPVKGSETDTATVAGTNPLITYHYEKNKGNILYYSYFSKIRPEFAGGADILLDTINKSVRFDARNIDFLALYDMAYSGGIGNLFHRPTRMARKDTNPIMTQADPYLSNFFCYDLIYQGISTENIWKYLTNDLDRIFNVVSHQEKQMVKCYIIREYGKSRLYQKGKATSLEDMAKSYVDNEKLTVGKRLEVSNCFADNVASGLGYHAPLPIINETGYKDRISFAVIWQPSDLKAMNEELHKVGLELTVEDRERDVIVLTDK